MFIIPMLSVFPRWKKGYWSKFARWMYFILSVRYLNSFDGNDEIISRDSMRDTSNTEDFGTVLKMIMGPKVKCGNNFNDMLAHTVLRNSSVGLCIVRCRINLKNLFIMLIFGLQILMGGIWW